MSEDGYQYGKMENRFAARKNLKRLLPLAEKAAETNEGHYEAASAQGDAMRPWIRIDNVYGVHIYKTHLEGWIADIELKEVPAGVPNLIGTPVAMPLAYRKDCEEYAVAVLSMLIKNTTDQKPEAPKENVFTLNGLTVWLPHDMIAAISQVRNIAAPDLSSDYVEGRLKEITDKYGDDLTEERFNALNKKDRDEIMVVCAMALAERMPRWPPNEPVPPKSMQN